MPVINLDIAELNRLLGKEYPVDELINRIPMIGADVGSPEGGILPVEFFPNRPDMFSIEGSARALRYFLAPEKELERMPLPDYPVKPSGIGIDVDPSVGDVRPYVVGAIIRGVEMTDQFIQSLMDHQERLHLSIGRKRVKAAIGVHDISMVEGPFLYTTESPDFSFVPLMKDEEMTLDEILNRHEKGIAYRHILEGKDRYPVILDRNGNVLSFPPVINGVLTAVREDTTDLFIDITGMELRPVTLALNILTTAFAERGADIESVEINYDPSHPLIGGEGLITPDLSWRKTTVSVKELNRLLNTSLPAEDWILPFKRMALRAEPVNGGKELKVGHPAYRADILHPWDIFEDAAIGLGYENIIEAHPSLQTTGAPLEIVPLVRRFQRAMTGLGFSEVKTLTLIGKKDGYENMDHPVPEDDIVLLNPITGDHTRLRVSLLPSLLSILRANRHRELPQRIFEAGIVVENGKNVWKGAGLAIHYRAGFTEIKSTVISLLPAFGKVFSLHPLPHPSFVLGRCAGIKIGDKEIGYFGELHPGVITAFELEYPVVAFEVYLEALRRVHSHFMGN